jgi:putative endonuclease
MRSYYTYIMTNKSGTLYVGVTSDLERRVYEHKTAANQSFTKRYQMNRLLYCEEHLDPESAIAREKQIKGWLRKKKLELIREVNPLWEDLAARWFGEGPDSSFAASSRPGCGRWSCDLTPTSTSLRTARQRSPLSHGERGRG